MPSVWRANVVAWVMLRVLFVSSMTMNPFGHRLPGSLRSSGFIVQAFSEPGAFLEHVRAHHVPVATLDIWMDNMNGMQLLAHMCAKQPSTRVIFITGRQDRAAQATVMQAGAFAFFIKPFDNNRFLEAVQNAFGQSPTKTEVQINSNARDSSLVTARTERSTRV